MGHIHGEVNRVALLFVKTIRREQEEKDMKNSLMIVFFAALVGLAFSTETGTFALDVPMAIAKSDSKSKDSKSSDSKSGCESGVKTITISSSALAAHLAHGDSEGTCASCECPPGVCFCTCADGTPGSPGPSDGAPGSPGISLPSSQRNLHGQ